jgi:hypothetical protein
MLKNRFGTSSVEYVIVTVLLVALIGGFLAALATTIIGKLNAVNMDLNH